jgi:myo-inositol 2-dehydrogenase/D-chiro-inositol 1-dehydrogenase
MAQTELTRREFLEEGALVTTGVAATLAAVPFVHAAGSDEIKVGVIGCGGRGSGAAENVLEAAPNVRIVALCDYFRHKALGLRSRLIKFAESERVKQLGNKVDVPEDRCFGGLDGYRRVLECDVNYVILATPPGFRPRTSRSLRRRGETHLYRKTGGRGRCRCAALFQSVRRCTKEKLRYRRRYAAPVIKAPYIETIQRIHDGAIGDPIVGRCYWNQGDIWFRKRESGMTDLDYQIHNWYHFVWLCGDHIVEQHVHNLDVMNWALRAHPLRCLGMGRPHATLYRPARGWPYL